MELGREWLVRTISSASFTQLSCLLVQLTPLGFHADRLCKLVVAC